MLTAPNMEAMSKTLGRDLNHKGYVPHNQEELDIYYKNNPNKKDK